MNPAIDMNETRMVNEQPVGGNWVVFAGEVYVVSLFINDDDETVVEYGSCIVKHQHRPLLLGLVAFRSDPTSIGHSEHPIPPPPLMLLTYKSTYRHADRKSSLDIIRIYTQRHRFYFWPFLLIHHTGYDDCFQ